MTENIVPIACMLMFASTMVLAYMAGIEHGKTEAYISMLERVKKAQDEILKNYGGDAE